MNSRPNFQSIKDAILRIANTTENNDFKIAVEKAEDFVALDAAICLGYKSLKSDKEKIEVYSLYGRFGTHPSLLSMAAGYFLRVEHNFEHGLSLLEEATSLDDGGYAEKNIFPRAKELLHELIESEMKIGKSKNKQNAVDMHLLLIKIEFQQFLQADANQKAAHLKHMRNHLVLAIKYVKTNSQKAHIAVLQDLIPILEKDEQDKVAELQKLRAGTLMQQKEPVARFQGMIKIIEIIQLKAADLCKEFLGYYAGQIHLSIARQYRKVDTFDRLVDAADHMRNAQALMHHTAYEYTSASGEFKLSNKWQQVALTSSAGKTMRLAHDFCVTAKTMLTLGLKPEQKNENTSQKIIFLHRMIEALREEAIRGRSARVNLLARQICELIHFNPFRAAVEKKDMPNIERIFDSLISLANHFSKKANQNDDIRSYLLHVVEELRVHAQCNNQQIQFAIKKKLAQLYKALGDLDNEVDCQFDAYELVKDSKDAEFYKKEYQDFLWTAGNEFRYEGKYKNAHDSFKKLTHKNLDPIRGRFGLAVLAAQENKYQDAQEEYEFILPNLKPLVLESKAIDTTPSQKRKAEQDKLERDKLIANVWVHAVSFARKIRNDGYLEKLKLFYEANVASFDLKKKEVVDAIIHYFELTQDWNAAKKFLLQAKLSLAEKADISIKLTATQRDLDRDKQFEPFRNKLVELHQASKENLGLVERILPEMLSGKEDENRGLYLDAIDQWLNQGKKFEKADLQRITHGLCENLMDPLVQEIRNKFFALLRKDISDSSQAILLELMELEIHNVKSIISRKAIQAERKGEDNQSDPYQDILNILEKEYVEHIGQMLFKCKDENRRNMLNAKLNPFQNQSNVQGIRKRDNVQKVLDTVNEQRPNEIRKHAMDDQFLALDYLYIHSKLNAGNEDTLPQDREFELQKAECLALKLLVLICDEKQAAERFQLKPEFIKSKFDELYQFLVSCAAGRKDDNSPNRLFAIFCINEIIAAKATEKAKTNVADLADKKSDVPAQEGHALRNQLIYQLNDKIQGGLHGVDVVIMDFFMKSGNADAEKQLKFFVEGMARAYRNMPPIAGLMGDRESSKISQKLESLRGNIDKCISHDKRAERERDSRYHSRIASRASLGYAIGGHWGR